MLSTQTISPAQIPNPALFPVSAIELESFFRNADQRAVCTEVRRVHAAIAEHKVEECQEEKCKKAMELQDQWNALLEERERLFSSIKRGKECLQQLSRDLAATRGKLEGWPDYERHCGINPLYPCLEEVAAQERAARFLPEWISRREEEMARLERRVQQTARQNGITAPAL